MFRHLLSSTSTSSSIAHYYTPVLELSMNTESVSGVQYSCESRPSLTRRERRHRYPVHSPQPEVEKDRANGFNRQFSPIFASFCVIFA